MGIEKCCFISSEHIGCDLDAEWEIGGPGAEDETFSCTDHVGDMLGDSPIYVITPMKG